MDIAKIRKKAAQARNTEKPLTQEPPRAETETLSKHQNLLQRKTAQNRKAGLPGRCVTDCPP